MALTPKEAFEAVTKLWPGTTKLERSGNSWTALNADGGIEASAISSHVYWALTNQYPLPEPKWRDARPEDLTYPFKEARFRDNNTDWTVGQLAGYFPSLSYPWTNKTGTGWRNCQVRDEA